MRLPSADADWYAVTVRHGNELIPSEALAAEELKAAGFETYLPWCRKKFVRRLRILRNEHTPAVPGYVFLATGTGRTVDWGSFRDNWLMRHVGSPLRGASGSPLRIPSQIIIAISVDEMNGVFDETGATKKANHAKLAERFAKGSEFRIEEGPFIGCRGWVESVTAHDRIRAMIEMFGGLAMAEFMPEQLSAA